VSITKFYSEYTCDNCGKKEISYRAYSAPDGWVEVIFRRRDEDGFPEDGSLQFHNEKCLIEYETSGR
jgi:hypothetical protein